jgi:hypothetical protein
MRSRVADEVRAAHEARIRAMTPEQRLTLAAKLRERGIADFMAGAGISRERALRRIREQRQAVRPVPSRSKVR